MTKSEYTDRAPFPDFGIFFFGVTTGPCEMGSPDFRFVWGAGAIPCCAIPRAVIEGFTTCFGTTCAGMILSLEILLPSCVFDPPIFSCFSTILLL